MRCREDSGWRLATTLLMLVSIPWTVDAEPVAEPARLLVIVVNKNNPTQNLDRAALRDIFLKRRQVWPNGETIIPLNGPISAPEKRAFDKLILGMTGQEAGAYWVKEAVTGRSTPPRRISTANLARQMVSSLPGAITYLELGKVDATVKVIAIDGLVPSSPRYRERFKY